MEGGYGQEGDDAPLTMSAVMKEVQVLADKFKTEDDLEPYVSPYAYLEKAAVLQEARCFNDSMEVRENPRKCCTVIAQLLHLNNTGQALASVEATEVFFGVTKLFMSEDPSLRRMVYLFIKEVAETCDPDDVIIVTSSLTKDMACDVDLYRANALRVLARIIDAAMLGAIERYVKQAIVDSSPMVSSAALVSATHLFNASPENAVIVRRWIGETQEATASPNEMVQLHAIQLLYQIKANDRLGISKLVQQFSQKNTLRSPLAIVCLIRYAAKLLHDEIAQGRSAPGQSIQEGSPIMRGGYQFLESCLRHRADMVIYEAARAICGIPNLQPQELSPAINSLQGALSSSKPAVRFATMRTLAGVAGAHPRVVSKCNEELEGLIADSNRSVATLAITTLLKTGSENSIDRLLKQISAFLTDIADEYKITVVKSLQQLCFTYPSRHRVIVGFLSNFLREEGGFDFKKSIVTGIVRLMKQIPETTESSLLHLCEFIEDCEFTQLSTQILQLLGEMGPKTSDPARYIRFVYNRVILENAAVRAAAVAALAKFAAACPSLRPSVLTLMKCGLVDEDDETRERTSVATRVLERAMEEFPHVPPGDDVRPEDVPADEPNPQDPAALALLDPMPVSFDKLERSMKAYMATPAAMEGGEELTFSALPVVEDAPADAGDAGESHANAVGDADMPSIDEPAAVEAVDPAAVIYAIPELASLGRVFRSSRPVPLTESETEYVVECVKHIFEDHVVLQFIVQNTIDDQRLDNVTVAVDGDSDLFEAAGEIPAEHIKYGDSANCFTVLRRDGGSSLAPTNFTCELHFTVVQVDPATGEEEGDGFEEEYPLEDLEVATSDFMAKVAVPDFRRGWETMDNTNEVLEKFALQFKNQEEAVAAVISFLGMQPCDGTGAVKPGGKPHMLHLSGVFVGGRSVLARAQVAMQGGSGGVVLKIAVRSEDAGVSRIVADCIS
jgi:coatomer protein complex subunit gamma